MVFSSTIPRLFLLLLCNMLALSVWSQNPDAEDRNLFLNPGFEEPNVCEHGVACSPSGWYSTQNGAVTYYIQTKKSHMGRYVLGVTLLIEDSERRTYVQTPLKCDLIKDQEYEFEMFIKAKNYATNSIGVFFSDRIVDTLTRYRLDFTPQLIFRAIDPFWRKDGKWIRMYGTYKAKGGERYAVIGNFDPSTSCSIKKVGQSMKVAKALYMIDDVKLQAINKNLNICAYHEFEAYVAEDWNRHPYSPLLFNKDKIKFLAPAVLPMLNADTTVEVGSTIILKNILFETAKATLLPCSYKELNQLMILLSKHPNMAIEISGHTDSQGMEDRNVKLSEARAQAVYAFLLEKGIDSNRLSSKGYGSEQPVMPNNTIEGRKQNRRVEFKVLKL